jgi:multiple sugar transport system permease protein
VGGSNYRIVLTAPQYWQAVRFTLVFTVVGVFGSWAVGLAFALALRPKLPWAGTLKVLLLLPWVVPVVVSTTAWNWLVATPQSPVPALLRALGFGSIEPLAGPLSAVVVVCLFKVWVSFPFMMMMMSAALAAVDHSVYEAAQMDGAGSWGQLRHITMPLIARTTYISWVLMTIFCVNDFASIFLLTEGGPDAATQSVVVLAYNTVFFAFKTGPGVAVAFTVTLPLFVMSGLLYRRIKRAAVAE